MRRNAQPSPKERRCRSETFWKTLRLNASAAFTVPNPQSLTPCEQTWRFWRQLSYTHPRNRKREK